MNDHPQPAPSWVKKVALLAELRMYLGWARDEATTAIAHFGFHERRADDAMKTMLRNWEMAAPVIEHLRAMYPAPVQVSHETSDPTQHSSSEETHNG